jgi:putative nucleotidyltransferase with HDIG domain
MKRRILFVDDEPNLLRSFQRMLRDMRDEWDLRFAQNGKDALTALELESYDVIVTDVLMPGMTGLELLDQVMKKYPNVIRVILSGHFDEDMTMGSLRLAHQSLHKPCTLDDLKSTIQRALLLQGELETQDLKDVVSQMDRLPSMPILYDKIVKLLNSPDASMRKVGEIISMDMGMTAKVLQLVNSAYFGLRRHINTPVEAVIYLGMEQVKALVLSVHIFSQAELKGFSPTYLKDLWDHSFLTGMYARLISQQEGLEKSDVDIAFTAGVLHDVGKLIFISNFPDKYATVLDTAKKERLPVFESELRTFNASHSQIGAYLLGIWGLPDKITEAVMFHHDPRMCIEQSFNALTVVHVANVLASRKVFGEQEIVAAVDETYLSSLKLTTKFPIWQEQCFRLGADNDTKST